MLEHLSGRLPNACIVGEPTWLDVIVAHRGFSVLEVEIRGRAAHSSRPDDGINAVTGLGRLLAAVEARDHELQSSNPHPHAGHGSLMAIVVRGGSAPFTIAARATAIIERRVIPGEPLDSGQKDVQAIVEQLALDADVIVRELVARDACELSDAAQALVELLPFTGRSGAPYWMESAMWEQAGVPTVVCGPAGGGLHTDVEWVELEHLRAYTDALASLITAFGHTPPVSDSRPQQ